MPPRPPPASAPVKVVSVLKCLQRILFGKVVSEHKFVLSLEIFLQELATGPLEVKNCSGA